MKHVPMQCRPMERTDPDLVAAMRELEGRPLAEFCDRFRVEESAMRKRLKRLGISYAKVIQGTRKGCGSARWTPPQQHPSVWHYAAQVTLRDLQSGKAVVSA